MLCCGYTLTDFPISIRLSSLVLWQSNDCSSASKATLMNMDKYFMWIHYERLHNNNKAKHNKTVCIFLGIYCTGHRSLCHLFTNHVSRASYDPSCVQQHLIYCVMPLITKGGIHGIVWSSQWTKHGGLDIKPNKQLWYWRIMTEALGQLCLFPKQTGRHDTSH